MSYITCVVMTMTSRDPSCTCHILCVIQYFSEHIYLRIICAIFVSDKESPVIEGCPKDELVISKLTPAGFIVPVAKDNSKGIKTFSVTPTNFDPSVVLKTDLTVKYSAVDFNNNNADVCAIKVRIKG